MEIPSLLKWIFNLQLISTFLSLAVVLTMGADRKLLISNRMRLIFLYFPLANYNVGPDTERKTKTGKCFGPENTKFPFNSCLVFNVGLQVWLAGDILIVVS